MKKVMMLWMSVTAAVSASAVSFAQEALAPNATSEGATEAAPADAGAESPAAASANTIEEIIVTAQRRAQNLQDVPISVSAVTASTLEAMAVTSTADMSTISPGLLLQRQVGAVMPFIRGIGQPNASGGQESSVAVYVDGFYVPQLTALNFSFNSIERIEVLKGPQGTLFGRNATGGLIQVISQDPKAAPALRAESKYGNFATSQNNLYVGGGVAENLTADFAVIHNEQGKGYGDNVVTGKDTNRSRETGLRSTWLYQAGDNTQFRLGLDYARVLSSLGIARQAAAGARTADGQGPQPGYWDINSNFKPNYQFDGGGVGLKISHDFGNLQLVSLSGYRDGNSNILFDQDATPLPIVDATLVDENRTLTQELQLLSPSDSKLQWIVGLYYFDYVVDYTLGISGAAATAAGGSFSTVSNFDTRSYAAYAQGTYPLGEATNVTAGLRYTKDDREFLGKTTPANGPTVTGTAPRTQKESEPTWRLALDHRFSPSLLGFASYNRGFKSGVYNTININQAPVKSERVDAFEIGLKSDLLDRRLRLNGSTFYYDYQDLQVQVIDAGVTVISNAAKAQIYGMELELTALPTDQLELTGGISLLHAEYDRFPGAQISEPKPAPQGGNYVCTAGQAAPSTNCPGPVDDPNSVFNRLSNQSADGNDLIRAPGFTGSTSVRYTIPSSVGLFAASGAYSYNGSYFWEPDNRAKQKAYSLVNAQLEWTHPNDRLSLLIFGANLTDKKYTQFLSGGALGDVLAAQPPRTYGAGLKLAFE